MKPIPFFPWQRHDLPEFYAIVCHSYRFWGLVHHTTIEYHALFNSGCYRLPEAVYHAQERIDRLLNHILPLKMPAFHNFHKEA